MARGLNYSYQDHPVITLLSIKLGLPECSSLKEKRSQLVPLIKHIRIEYNVSVAETGLQDIWHSAWISCVIVSNDVQHNSRVANEIIKFIENRYPGIIIEEQHITNR